MNRVLMSTVLVTALGAGVPVVATGVPMAAGGVDGVSAVEGPSAGRSPGLSLGPLPGRSDRAAALPRPGEPRFVWPLPGTREVVRRFEAPAHRFGPGHRGVDLAGAVGSPVVAAGAGTVVFAGPVAGRTVVSIDHPGGLRTTYEPLSPTVRVGDVVSAGQRIGTLLSGHVGPPGDDRCARDACLHWGVRRGTDYLDPLRLLGLGRVRLLPWRDPAR